MFMPYMFFDRTMILVIIGMIISGLASSYVNSTYRKYEGVRNKKNLRACDVARIILKDADIDDVAVNEIAGDLTDNYNSRTKILSLSERVSESHSVSAIGVAAHECGHAIQDSRGYFPLKLRASLVPVVNFGATISIPLILIGAFFFSGTPLLVTIGLWCFALTFLFQVVTLPVEFNASRRALVILEESQTLDKEEVGIARKVLVAAALTYVAAAITSLLQLVRLIILFGNNKRN